MRKWIAGVVVFAVLLVAVGVAAGPSLLFRFPVLLRVISQLRDPIGPHRDVVWDSGPAAEPASASARPPNVVVILVDDLGWNDLTWNGGGVAGGTVPTPHIDSIAADGVDFRQGYAGNATCAPSRAALMTGRYPPRFGFESTPAPAAMGKLTSELMDAVMPEGAPRSVYHEDRVDEVPPMDEQGVPAEEVTLAEVLGDAGYHSVMLGKWHLGATAGQRPVDQGFDESLGFYAGGSLFGDPEDPHIVSAKQDFDPIDQFIWPILPFAVRENNEARFTPDLYMTDYLSREAARAIEANRNRPFFMYLAYNAPHTPLQATRADYEALSHVEAHAERVYAGMIRSLDRGVGIVLDALKQNGLEENTLVIFSSDNGGAHYIGLPEVNQPFRGWKMTFFEGGLHSPFFVKWPAQIGAGVRSSEPVSHIDIFTTVAAAAGAPIPGDRPIDGIDLMPLARGEQGAERASLFWRSGGLSAVRSGAWKLQVDERQDRRWLYDLQADPTERHNLAAQHPQRLRELQAQLDAHNRELGPRHFPVLVEAVVPIDRTLADPYVPGETFAYWPN
jgi:arylsulfatase A-like enzyme